MTTDVRFYSCGQAHYSGWSGEFGRSSLQRGVFLIVSRRRLRYTDGVGGWELRRSALSDLYILSHQNSFVPERPNQRLHRVLLKAVRSRPKPPGAVRSRPDAARSRPEPFGHRPDAARMPPGSVEIRSFKDRPDTISSPILVSLPLDGC